MVEQDWPALPLEEWEDTYHTLHMWTQIVGKIRLALTPLINHWWEVDALCERARADHLADPVQGARISRSSSTSSTTAWNF